jgi:hypothetical protein
MPMPSIGKQSRRRQPEFRRTGSKQKQRHGSGSFPPLQKAAARSFGSSTGVLVRSKWLFLVPTSNLFQGATMEITKNEKGENAKHRNHTVPKGLLKRWLVNFGTGPGHWVLDCASGTVVSRKGNDAKFAIREYRYVPVRLSDDGIAYRDESLEDWFSKGENHLAPVTDVLEKGELSKIKQVALSGFLEAAIVLGFRSWYEYDRVEERLKQDAPHFSDEQRGRLVIDAFKKIYGSKLSQFKNWDYVVFSGMSEPLLICDRPLFDMTLARPSENCLMIPLAPDLLLLGLAPENPARACAEFRFRKGSGKLAAKANQMTVERAREFIVGGKEQLEALLPRFTEEEFGKRKMMDTWRGWVNVAPS